MIKVVLWDIDNTLLDFPAAEGASLRRCFEEFDLGPCDAGRVARYSALNETYWRALERGEIAKERLLTERFQVFFQAEGLPERDWTALNAAYQKYLGDTVVFLDNGYEVVASLRGVVKQYAVTNGAKAAQDRKLRKSGLIDLFDGVFISEEVGGEKPSMAFFTPVLQAIGPYKKEEILLVGDSLTSDMAGANAAGLPCCWYDPKGLPAPQGLRIDHIIRRLGQVPAIVAASR